MSNKIGLYAGSFDPFTVGHLDIVKSAILIVDILVIAIGIHPIKSSYQDLTVRLASIDKAVKPLKSAIKIISFDDLLVDCAKREGANILIRGLRNSTDFEYEHQLASMIVMQAPEITPIFLLSRPEHSFISSTHVRQIAKMHGDISKFVP